MLGLLSLNRKGIELEDSMDWTLKETIQSLTHFRYSTGWGPPAPFVHAEYDVATPTVSTKLWGLYSTLYCTRYDGIDCMCDLLPLKTPRQRINVDSIQGRKSFKSSKFKGMQALYIFLASELTYLVSDLGNEKNVRSDEGLVLYYP